MIKRIWKVIVLFGSMLLICGCGKEKLSEEDILQKQGSMEKIWNGNYMTGHLE